jgi:hypothetical protein
MARLESMMRRGLNLSDALWAYAKDKADLP